MTTMIRDAAQSAIDYISFVAAMLLCTTSAVVSAVVRLQIKVLCVDDEPGMLELAKQFLERDGGIYVDTVSSPEEALRLLKEHEYDAVVSDYSMPGMDGLQLLKEVRAQCGRIPFILLTGKGKEDVAIDALNSGADFYLQKSTEVRSQFAELLNMIRMTVEQRRAEKTAHETSELLGAVVRSSPTPLVTVNTEGQVLLWNLAAERVFGWTEEETIGRTPPIVPPEFAKEFRDIVARTLSGEKLEGLELERVRKDGIRRDVIAYFARIQDKDGVPTGVMASFVDITEHKRMEEDLRRTNRLYEFLSHTNAMIVRAKDQKSLLEEVCRVAVEHGGFNVAWSCLMTEDNGIMPVASSGIELGTLQEIRRKVNETGEPNTPADIAVREGRTTISTDVEADYAKEPWLPVMMNLGIRSLGAMPISQGGKIVGSLTICSTEQYFSTKEERQLLEEVSSDVSYALEGLRRDKAKRRAQATLKREAEFTQAVLDTAGAIIVVLDREGRIVRFNKEAEEVTGYTSDEMHGRPVWEVFIPEEYQANVMNVFEQLVEDGSSNEYENHWITKDGTSRIIDWSNTVLKDKDGSAGYVIATGIDVTERRATQEELKRRTEEAVMARNRAQTYLDFMTHDIMNIITPLTSYSEMVLRGGSPKGVETYSKKIFEQTTRLARFVTHVRRLAHSEWAAKKGLEPADLRDLIGRLESEVRDRFHDKVITVSYSLPEGPVTVQGKGYVEDVINEVLDNAVKHSGSKEVMIEVTIKPRSIEEVGRFWRIEIADHGPGIPDEQKKLLLAESFAEESSNTRGVATSFSFIGMTVEHLGGSMSITDRVEGDHTKGARIVLDLPVVTEHPS